MPAEQTHKMDDLLKSYALKRREEAGPAMQLSSATRQLLQSEVDRAFRGGPPSPHESAPACAVSNFWPRLLLGGAVISVLLIAAGLWLRVAEDREAKLAGIQERHLYPFSPTAPQSGLLNAGSDPDALSTTVRGFALDTALPSAQPAASNLPDAADTTEAPLPKFARQLQESSSEPGQAAHPTPLVRSALRRVMETEALTNGPGFQTQLQLASDSAQSGLQLARETPNEPPVISQEQVTGVFFTQVEPATRYRRNLNSPPLPKVLTSFEVQQAAGNVRIVDADRSVYEGTILSQAAAPTAQADTNQSFSFRAAGTNRTLRQLVVFTGDFTPGASEVAAGLAFSNRSIEQDAANFQPGVPAQARARTMSRPQSSNSANAPLSGRIIGNASVGGKDQFRIEAQQVTP